MNQPNATYQTPSDVIHRGWETLVKTLGPSEAAQFVTFLRRGYGDSVEARGALWGNKTVREIDQDIQDAKQRGEI